MHYYEVAPKQIIRIGSDSFTYCSTEEIEIGQLVYIEVGKKQILGLVVEKVAEPKYATKPISSLLEGIIIPKQLIELSLWLSSYYESPLANVLQTVLPTGIHKKRRQKEVNHKIADRKRTKIVFNNDQSTVIKTLSEIQNGTFLLQGITGSGKTEVYIEIVKQSILSGKSAIVLVPEIALTSQLVSEFSKHFDNLILTHSKMTESARHGVWIDSYNSDRPVVVIGPRSALFSPLKNIGAIIVDEAHEPSYKQEKSPRYSALRAATILGRLHGAKVIFGSATPSIVDRYLAEKSTSPILKLNSLAIKDSVPPSISVVDMKKRENFQGHRFISKQLSSQISETLKIKKQILIFHNRRGSASTTLCVKCGWTAECPNCFLPLALHSDNHILMCHICGYNINVPTSCPKCGDVNIIHKGIGTKLVEDELRKLFPKANIARFDGDNSNDETLSERYEELYNGAIDIAIGTQVVAKGLDLPNLRTVGIIQADSGLALPDFNTNERIFQLLSQVVGRVGRNKHKTNIVVQTYQPNHPSVINGLSQNYEEFYKNNIIERKKGLFPPFTFLLKLTCVYKTESGAINSARKLANDLKSSINNQVQILGPTPSFYERQNGTYKWQLVLKSPSRQYLIQAIKAVPKNWQVEIDPTSLL